MGYDLESAECAPASHMAKFMRGGLMKGGGDQADVFSLMSSKLKARANIHKMAELRAILEEKMKPEVFIFAFIL